MVEESEPGSNLTMYKHKAVGGNGGYSFDSGCNPSGVTKVHIECGYMRFHGFTYLSTIKRIFLEFSSSCGEQKVPMYHGCGVEKSDNKTFTFYATASDPIAKVNVWSDERVAKAVQFETRNGVISPMYGITEAGETLTVFQGGNDAHLVGIHGRFGGLIDMLGFTFASSGDTLIPFATAVKSVKSEQIHP
mmetsp:Transcript_30448/g.37052  ORF Transcript_30448/g.37052 Transcript_30448/m.37052 type:complete len:190 (-) Transcript_30448:186-755(-)